VKFQEVCIQLLNKQSIGSPNSVILLANTPQDGPIVVTSIPSESFEMTKFV